MRITTNAILRDYKSNLSQSITNLNLSRTHVMTNRSFNSVAENPTSAARASKLHRSFYRNSDYIDMVSEVQSRQDEQENALSQINDMAKVITKDYGLEALNGSNRDPEVRQSYATAIRNMQQSMVASLNGSYEDTYVFAGTDGMNAPFVLSDNGTLTYRGINVDAASGSADYTKLNEYAQEKLHVDIGMGLTLDDHGNAVSSSAFNTSLPGIKAAGYGKDKDGLSNNIVVLTGQLADALEDPSFDEEEYGKLLEKIESANSNVLDNITQLGVQTNFLKTTKSRLDDQQISLQEQMQSVEGVDMANAITDYMWDQYAYNAALKVGTSILSPSFIDFMN